jgi:periplasmic protein TonB
MTARLTASAWVMAAALFAQAAEPLRVAPDGQESRLIYAPRPEYPKLARQMRISGRVRLAALIGRDGTVQELRLIGGHPLLVPAAMNAVKRWRYRPAFRYGRPIEVLTTIDVHFTLDSAPLDSETPVRV